MAWRMMNKWRQLKQAVAKLHQVDYSLLDEKLLDQSSLQQLRDWALENSQIATPTYPRMRQSYGEQESQKLGQGLEFEHSRLYRPGDERKHVNWRVSAKMQELHVKQFNEFQQSQVHILVDSFGSMRFGTRCRTKLAQAIRTALYIAHSVTIRHSQVYAELVGVKSCSRADYNSMEPYLNRAYPPQSRPAADDMAAYWLESLSANASGNRLVVMISDFQFIAELDSTAWQRLNRVMQNSAVIAIQILDPIEQQLPDGGIYAITANDGLDSREFDLSNKKLREKYSDNVNEFFNLIESRLRTACLHSLILQADEDRIDAQLHEPLINYI